MDIIISLSKYFWMGQLWILWYYTLIPLNVSSIASKIWRQTGVRTWGSREFMMASRGFMSAASKNHPWFKGQKARGILLLWKRNNFHFEHCDQNVCHQFMWRLEIYNSITSYLINSFCACTKTSSKLWSFRVPGI